MNEFNPILKGKTITLRHIEPNFHNAHETYNLVKNNQEHLVPWLAWADPKITSKPEDSMSYLIETDKLKKTKEKNDFGIYKDNKLIGKIGLFDIDHNNKKAEIGYWICKKHQGEGIISQSLKLIEKEAFENLKINRLQIKCDSLNSASANVAKNNSYKLEGTIRNDFFSNYHKEHRDSLMFSKLKDEYIP